MTPSIYDPTVFSVSTVEEAKAIILTPSDAGSPAERWKIETPYLADLAIQQIHPDANSVVLDYGCGIGRISSALIKSVGCRALGVDISSEMRSLAPSYEPSARFAAISRAMLEALVGRGFHADSAIAVWVLQHALEVDDDIALLRSAVRPGGHLFVVNTLHRAIPVRGGRWENDGTDIRARLGLAFQEIASGSLDATVVGPGTAAHSFWAVYI
jgi:SAM-dependent methyltransferase